jgi:hypothetical protein
MPRAHECLQTTERSPRRRADKGHVFYREPCDALIKGLAE